MVSIGEIIVNFEYDIHGNYIRHVYATLCSNTYPSSRYGCVKVHASHRHRHLVVQLDVVLHTV
jgi:hypothetical protein